MAEFLMSEFLSTVAADYAYTLSVTPHKEMPIQFLKNQKMFFADDGTPVPVSISSTNRFIVTLQWDMLIKSDAEIITELWCDSNKADGIRRSFRWYNPSDTKYYIVNFLEPPSLKVYPVNWQGIDQCRFIVWGNYVA